MLTLPKSLKVGYHALLTPKLGGIPRRYCSSGLEAAKKRSKVLRKLLKQYSKAYYVESKSLVSDEEYDKLFEELRRLEASFPDLVSKTSPTQVVGSSLKKGKNGEDLVPHKTPMLSLANAFSLEDLRNFDARIRRLLDSPADVAYVAEFKYDGIALALHYENGEFVRALTRGDGKLGEDVTHAILRFLPQVAQPLRGHEKFGSHLEVRGETFLTKAAFQECNTETAAAFASARNLASGLLKRKTGKSKSAPEVNVQLSFVGYGLICGNATLEPKTHAELLRTLKSLGLPNGEPYVRHLAKIDDFEALEQDWASKRSELPFEADGIVLKMDDRTLYDRLGFTSHSPRFAIAWKFSAKQATTTIKEIELSVGRSGKVTPVALVEPVQLAGSVISRATLHNRDYVEKLHLIPGCRVIIERSGDVIPKIVGRADDTKPDPSTSTFASVDWTVCPCELKTPLVPVGNVDLACTNPSCAPQKQRKLEHFASALDIEGLGPSTLRQLVDFGVVNDVGDLFKLDAHVVKLKVKDGWGDKKLENLLAKINHAKQHSALATLIFALGIPHVGSETAETLASKVGSLQALMRYNTDELAQLDDIGPVVALSIATYMSHPSTKQRLQELEQLGFLAASAPGVASINKESRPGSHTKSESPLNGLTVVITGALTNMSRKEAENLVKQHGGKTKSTLTKGTDMLVEGKAPTRHTASSKLLTARELGVRIVSEEEFLKMANQT